MAFVVEFTASANQTSYINNAINGKKIKVLREGLYQYTQLGSNYIIKAGNTILFVPALALNERIRVQTID